jgi:hypothetical protein
MYSEFQLAKRAALPLMAGAESLAKMGAMGVKNQQQRQEAFW